MGLSANLDVRALQLDGLHLVWKAGDELLGGEDEEVACLEAQPSPALADHLLHVLPVPLGDHRYHPHGKVLVKGGEE